MTKAVASGFLGALLFLLAQGHTAISEALRAATKAPFVTMEGQPRARLPDPPAGASPGPAAAGEPGERALSQAAPSTTPAAAPPGGKDADRRAQGAGPLPEVDESALRYFAQKGDIRRLKAEIARLKALYPNWTPPADPLAVPAARDKQIDAMWKLYADGKYAELHKAISGREAREPGWRPPADLLKLLAVAETRERLVNASKLRQYDMVIRLAASTPSLLTCGEIDMLWRVGEAFARTDRPQRAEDDYRYILTNCDDRANRLATMQKALALLPRSRVESLLALGPGDEFASIRDELARRSVAKGGGDPAFSAPPEDLKRLEALAQSANLASDALLLGWYGFRRNRLQDAERWFRKARQEKDSASASQGLAQVLLGMKKPAAAEAVAYPWRTGSADARAVYLSAVANLLSMQPTPEIPEDVLRRMAAEVMAAKDPAAAQQFGWYARALDQFDAADAWFRKALDWKADDEPSAYGLALTMDSLGRKKELAAFARQWAARSPRIARIVGRTTAPAKAQRASGARAAAAGGAPGPGPAAVPAEGRHPPQPGCSRHVDAARLWPQAALDRGWCLMNMQRPLEAARSFGVALRKGSAKVRQDAAYGQSLAYLRLGLTAKAAIAATEAPQPAKRRAELQASILSGRATALFDEGRYDETLITLDRRARIGAERDDLMVLRGYAYLKLHRLLDARKVFRALAATGNRDAIRGLADLQRLMNPQSD